MACGELADGLEAVHGHVASVLDALRGDVPPPTAVKAGPAGMANGDWRKVLAAFAAGLPRGIEPVAVAYADWRSAAAPRPDDLIAVAAAEGFRMLLIDTWKKDGPALLEADAAASLEGWMTAARRAGLWVAVAGRLTATSIPRALEYGPDVIAVRSAVCAGGRLGTVCGKMVRDVGKLCGLPATLPAIRGLGELS